MVFVVKFLVRRISKVSGLIRINFDIVEMHTNSFSSIIS